jgi:hypothetical protein
MVAFRLSSLYYISEESVNIGTLKVSSKIMIGFQNSSASLIDLNENEFCHCYSRIPF